MHKHLRVAFFTTLLLVAVGGGVFYYIKYHQAVNASPQAEARDLTAYIGERVQLPHESPTVATVVDKSKLTNKSLASKAANGDKMLIFTNAKRLVLYRPSTKKVIDILSITSPNTTQTQAATPTPSAGTKTVSTPKH